MLQIHIIDVQWRVRMFIDIIKALPEVWKVRAMIEALCMFKVEYMSCYKKLANKTYN